MSFFSLFSSRRSLFSRREAPGVSLSFLMRFGALLIRLALMDLIHARMAGADLAERAPEVLEWWAEVDPIQNRATRPPR